MRFKELQTVVLNRDLSELGLRRGDLGAVVQVYEPDGIEVEYEELLRLVAWPSVRRSIPPASGREGFPTSRCNGPACGRPLKR